MDATESEPAYVAGEPTVPLSGLLVRLVEPYAPFCAELPAFDHDHEIRHRRRVEPELLVRRGLEAVDRAALYEEFRSSAEPGIIVPEHLERLDEKHAAIPVLIPTDNGDGGRRGPRPAAFFQEHAQRSESGIVVAVDYPYGARHGQLLVHKHRIHHLGAVRPVFQDISHVGLGPVSRVIGDYGQGAAVPVLRIRPVYLDIRRGQRAHVLLRARNARPGPGIRRKIFGEKIPYGSGIGRGLRLRTLIPYAGPRRLEKIVHHVLLVISVSGRGAHGIIDFHQVLPFERKFRHYPGDFRKRRGRY